MKAKGTVIAVCAAVLMIVAPARAATGAVGHWNFDEGSGAAAADDSGFGDNGSVQGATTWVTGKRGPWALSFDGSTGRVTMPNAAQLEPSSVTVQAWVRFQGDPGKYKYVVAKGAEGCNGGATYALYTGVTGGLMFYVSDTDGHSFTFSPDAGPGIWDGAWHRVTGTYDVNMVRLYVDGTEVGSGNLRTSAMDYNLSVRELSVGNYNGCTTQSLGFPGAIDEPKIYGRALSATDVANDDTYPFAGFFAPVNNEPVLNVTKAGSAIPVKFSLGANYGLGILTAGSPSSQTVNCSSSAPLDAVEQTVTAGASSLQYDAIANQYTYVWKTDKGWTNTCRRLSVGLNDGSVHTASFSFK